MVGNVPPFERGTVNPQTGNVIKLPQWLTEEKPRVQKGMEQIAAAQMAADVVANRIQRVSPESPRSKLQKIIDAARQTPGPLPPGVAPKQK